MVQSAQEHTTTKRWFELTAEEICQIANTGYVFGNARRPPTGSSGIYWIISKRPKLSFFVPQHSPKWMALVEAEKNGTLEEHPDVDFQRICKSKANMTKMHGMTEARMKEMTHYFDEYGEFQTDDLETAQYAFRAAFASDHTARMHYESKKLEPWENAHHMRKGIHGEPHYFENKIQDEKKNPPKK